MAARSSQLPIPNPRDWKKRELIGADGKRYQRKELGIIVVVSIEDYLFEMKRMEQLRAACASLAATRGSCLTLVMDRYWERGQADGPLSSGGWYGEKEVPDILSGWDTMGNADVPEWDGTALMLEDEGR